MFNNKKETLPEKLWRFRSILAIASVPVLMLIVVFLFAPRSPHSISLGSFESSSLNPEELIYSVVIDAGSTGSRVHVLSFSNSENKLKLLNDHFQQINPGLSSYAKNATEAAYSLKPLIDEALRVVPQDKQASTPISVRATAGLRLLKGNQAEAILQAVRLYLHTIPFKSSAQSVSILDGQEEGAFAWLTLNYLLGRLDAPVNGSSSSHSSGASAYRTVAAIDLGGGSVQEAFLLSSEAARHAPAGYVKRLHAMGRSFNVYVHSYLGYGLMAARAQAMETHPADLRGACFADGVHGNFSYAGKRYVYRAHDVKERERAEKKRLAGAAGCAELSVKALKKGVNCGVRPELITSCSFAGAWRGVATEASEREYFVSSYFFDRAIDAGIITDKAAAQWSVAPDAFQKAASHACAAGLTVADLSQRFPTVAAEHLPFFCLDLSYCATLLLEGFALPADRNVTLVKQVSYDGKMIEAAWPLGAALNEMVATAA